MSARILLGASGWSYRDWVGPFYPEGTSQDEYLTHYAESFRAVEVDSTFYGIPQAKTVARWAERTPDDFRFSLKVPGLITHGAEGKAPDLARVLRETDGAFERFLEVVGELGEKLATVLFQFPYFRVREMDADDFRERLDGFLDRVPAGMPVAVEVRNKGWIGGDYLEMLKSHGAAAVLIDHPYLPPPLKQLEQVGVTSSLAYIRLLGDRKGIEKKTRKWGEVVENKTSRLREWTEVLRALARREEVQEVYAFSNNHFAGHGPATVRELEAALADSPF